tara:strand:- start:22311 stop:23732 length:1422 start_codon:yes stop_codon:yes gene_type:complete
MRYLLILIVGLASGFFVSQSEILNSVFTSKMESEGPEVLYWVAPMDANYKRDKPGKSPMGMDLVAVYAEAEKAEPKILYWVGPMDANYRRDKPGKSPMGMDLIPVYDDGGAAKEEGTVTISAAVENNLGVRTATVIKDDFSLTIKSLGTIQANGDALWQINSRVSGWIEKLHVKSIGTEVEKGQKLYELYSPELVKAQESLFNAIQLKRRTLIDSSKIRLKALGINSSQINQIIKNKKVSNTITVYAPHKGTISELKVNEGAFIAPSMVVIEAVNLDTVWVDVEVFSAQVPLVKLNDIAKMTLDYFPGQEWKGKVDFIYPEMSENNRTLRVRVQFDNLTAQLKPNMFASVSLTPTMNEKRLQIPREAVIYAGNMNRVVLAMGEGKFRSVLVNLGLENRGAVEVLSGLEEGQKIVTSAQFLLDSESSISADFERMLEEKESQENKAKYDPSKKDVDLDWLDLSIININKEVVIL